MVVEQEGESFTLNDLEFKEPKGTDAYIAAERIRNFQEHRQEC